MFTGIIETVGTVSAIEESKGNLLLTIQSAISAALQVDQSVSHNGICLTVVKKEKDTHQVEAVEETLSRTNLRNLKTGDKLNLERALTLERRLDGHLVQGHVDAVGHCTARVEKAGSTLFSFDFPRKFAPLIIEKGSVALNGISLTVFEVGQDCFSVAVIPYTLQHTTMDLLQEGDEVNLEFDLVGKYVLRSAESE